MKSDLQSLEVSDGCWCALAQDRRRWRELCLQCLAVQQDCTQVKDVICALCGRSFRRECDKARHKCIAERERPIEEQSGAVQCPRCERWFYSAGGLAVHRCSMLERPPQATNTVSYHPILCSVCDRTFSRPGDLKRHKCLDERARPICEQRGAVQCQHCQCWMRSAGGLAIHQRKCCPPS